MSASSDIQAVMCKDTAGEAVGSRNPLDSIPVREFAWHTDFLSSKKLDKLVGSLTAVARNLRKSEPVGW